MAYKFKFKNFRTLETIAVETNCYLTALEMMVTRLGWRAPNRMTTNIGERDGWLFTNSIQPTKNRFYDMAKTPSYYEALESFVTFMGFKPMNQNANDVMGAFAGNDVIDYRRGLRAMLSRLF